MALCCIGTSNSLLFGAHTLARQRDYDEFSGVKAREAMQMRFAEPIARQDARSLLQVAAGFDKSRLQTSVKMS
jgi:hypothetical protein